MMLKTKTIIILICLFWVIMVGYVKTVWAGEGGDSSTSTASKDSWANSDMDVDKEMDNGADDDKSDDSTESSKFQKDLDDAYNDTSADKDDSYDSKFQQDQDGDDKDTDTSDEGKPAVNR
jgi:hypothetical protein